jgi:hypothetical protein
MHNTIYCIMFLPEFFRGCPGVRSPTPPWTRRPTMRWGYQGGGARHWSRGWGRRFTARPPPPSGRAEYASVTAGQTPGVTDQDLHQSEAWLGNRRRLTGVIGAVVASPLPQAHCHGCGPGEHLARPRRGTGGCILRRLP